MDPAFAAEETEFHSASETDFDSASLSAYLREIDRTRTLTHKEERALFDRIARGDGRAYHRLITANLKVVVSVCRPFRNRGLPLGDLIGEGNLGLIRAAQRFDGSRGCRFIGYAAWWIRRRVLRALAEHSRSLAAPAAADAVPAAAALREPAQGSLDEAQRREAWDALERLRERGLFRPQAAMGTAYSARLEAICSLLGITRSRFRKIRGEAMRRLGLPAPGGQGHPLPGHLRGLSQKTIGSSQG